MKTIGDFLKQNTHIKEHRTYFLDDKLESNPFEVCPNCNSSYIEVLRTHNCEGTDYECKKCGLTYEIVDCTRREDVWH